MADVFISYSRANQAQVAILADALAREDFSVWWDAELPPHRSYGDVITEQIASAKAVIVIWSDTAAASEWVRAEADLGRNQKKLIQASLDDCMPPMPFNQIQFAFIGDWLGEEGHGGWRKIKASLNELCARASVERDPIRAVPAAPSPPRREPIAERKSSIAMPALIGGALVAVGAVGFFLWNGGDGRQINATSQPVEQAPAPEDAEASSGAAPTRSTARFNLAAVIDDPDGYSNVRDGPSTRAKILTRIEEGEAFTTFAQTGGWWQVRTADGTVGWMDRALIKPLSPRGSGVAPVAVADEVRETDPTVASAATAGAILPGSSERRLTEGDLAALSADQLTLARNEIYARHGRRFERAELRSHFSRFDWYRPTDNPSPLSALEEANVALIARAEANR